MMPGKTGVEVCQILRTQPEFAQTLIIFLTAVSDETIQIKGLESGADDYVAKPVSPKVLTSKVHALFRRLRKEEVENKKIVLGDFSIDPASYLVTIGDREISLAKKEFELLYLLASRPGRVMLRNEILSQVWGSDVIVGDRTIDVHIRKIRQKLEMDCITTVKDYLCESFDFHVFIPQFIPPAIIGIYSPNIVCAHRPGKCLALAGLENFSCHFWGGVYWKLLTDSPGIGIIHLPKNQTHL
jgi:two-component system alkaline phosphatase synthesis response regulator PhoP